METKPPLPPFTLETATAKVKAAENAWNTRDPERVALAYTEDSEWRNRSEFFSGRATIKEFLTRKWTKELDYRLKKELWCFMDNRIAVRFEYEYHDQTGAWYRAYGNENWEFAANGLMMCRFASINDLSILESERKFRWERTELLWFLIRCAFMLEQPLFTFQPASITSKFCGSANYPMTGHHDGDRIQWIGHPHCSSCGRLA